MASLAPVLCNGSGESRSSFATPYEPCPTLSAVSGRRPPSGKQTSETLYSMQTLLNSSSLT
eukprot:2288896-Heterocapsa_arctica.AAC.1